MLSVRGLQERPRTSPVHGLSRFHRSEKTFLYQSTPVQDVFSLRFGHQPQTWPYGTQVSGKAVRFKLWAPVAEKVELLKIRPLTAVENQHSKDLVTLQKWDAITRLKIKLLEEEDERFQDQWHAARKARNQNKTEQIETLKATLPAIEKSLAATKSKVPSLTDRIVGEPIPLQTDAQGNFYTERSDFRPAQVNSDGSLASPGTLYMYRLTKKSEGKAESVMEILPDPRSRYQPEDVHGPSELLDTVFSWDTQGEAFHNTPKDVRNLLLYRLHVGTFTEKGTFDAAIEKLDYLKETGFTAVELMPIQEFPGQRNWGYDMVGYYAPENAYGRPEDLKRFIDECHKRGLAVILDVVYNHVGNEGNVLNRFDDSFLYPQGTPWGPSFNFHRQSPHYHAKHPKAGQNPALDFVIDNTHYWIQEFHVDGFRFDQTRHIEDVPLKRITQSLYALRPSPDLEKPKIVLISEDGRCSNHVTEPPHPEVDIWGGLGFKLQWLFDFYHVLRSVLTGVSHMNTSTSLSALADFLKSGFRQGNGWMNNLWNGVLFPESHDEAGNHDGSRLHRLVTDTPGKSRIASVLPYLIPGVPYNFMGHEYGEKTPFYFFADYGDPLFLEGLIRDKWRNSHQPGLPTDKDTFLDARLSWHKDPALFALTKEVLALRKTVPALWQGGRTDLEHKPIYDVQSHYLGSNVLAIHRKGFKEPQAGVDYEDEVFMVMNFSGYDYAQSFNAQLPPGEWEEILNTEAETFSGRLGWTNAGKVFSSGGQAITLPGHSVLVFRRKR